jgi:hypothetical protein
VATVGQRIDRGGRQLTCGPVATVPVAVKFDSKSKFKRIQIMFKFVQTLTAPKKGHSRALKI